MGINEDVVDDLTAARRNAYDIRISVVRAGTNRIKTRRGSEAWVAINARHEIQGSEPVPQANNSS